MNAASEAEMVGNIEKKKFEKINNLMKTHTAWVRSAPA